jgi:cation transport ATPase
MSSSPIQAGVDGAPVRLWNPNAAANWCLLFSPAFGSYLQMLNWEAMGRPDEAKKSRWWFIVAVALLVVYALGGALLPAGENASGQFKAIGFVFLLSWYFISGRAQARFVKATYGDDYARRSWSQPLLIAFGVFVAYVVTAFVLAFAVAFIGASRR